MDEWNTMSTGAMKTMQPILDDTSTHFEYNGKLYQKNMNCKFIITLTIKTKVFQLFQMPSFLGVLYAGLNQCRLTLLLNGRTLI